MVRVLAFGTYDLLHPGHEHHLKNAAALGDELFVVVARDETVMYVKGRKPQRGEHERLAAVSALPYVTKALLGHPGDKYRIIEEINPDVIVIGYDQTAFVDKLRDELSARGLNPKIVKFSEGFETHKHKSSKYRTTESR